MPRARDILFVLLLAACRSDPKGDPADGADTGSGESAPATTGDTAADDSTPPDTSADSVADTGPSADTGDTALGAASGLVGEVSLAAADARIHGADYDFAGQAVAGLGDVDGDGRDDVLVVGGQDAAGHLFYGPLAGDRALASAEAWTVGRSPGDDGGVYAATGADLDGDGLSDVILASYEADDRAGRVYVLGAAPVGETDVGGGVVLTGEPSEGAGISVDAADDLTGDGVPDLVVGAIYHASRAGGVYVVEGVPASGDLADQYATIEGEAASVAGGGCASAGDVDGDRLDDLLVGAQSAGTSERGRVYLVLGPIPRGTSSVAAADATWVGEADQDRLGRSVDGPGDTDGDGYADILTGTLASNGAGPETGSAYLVRGSALHGSGSIGAADVIFRGEAAGDGVGAVVSAAGDLDGDGFADLLLPAEGSDRAARDAGAVYVLYGPVATGTRDLASADATLLGDAPDLFAGGAVAPAGDTDGDGWPDVLVAGSWDTRAALDGGTVWVVRSGPR